jgi:hypothetical protein
MQTARRRNESEPLEQLQPTSHFQTETALQAVVVRGGPEPAHREQETVRGNNCCFAVQEHGEAAG